ncbi:MAG: dihydropteroate synthase [Cytophagaceae bacterium]|nr:dihydropteroate synthase [Cytophagaceae bacterium]
MGILNVTPDSFYDGGKYQSEDMILKKVEKMVAEGVSIIDIGGYSSRPGAKDISEKEEISRIVPAIELIKKRFPASIISIDTFRAQVAASAVDNGADIINDISGGGLDENMFTVVSRLKVPYILMHMKGNPQTMNAHAHYENMLAEITDYFQQKIIQLNHLGVYDIIIDPGFGFAKTVEQNFILLRNLNYLKILNLPILVGVSRKSMVYKTLNADVSETLNGTTILNTMALLNGANILRVHDVKESIEAVKLFKAVYPWN